MSAHRLRKRWMRLIAASLSASLAFGCVTDLQFRDFVSSTVVRTFWTSVAQFVQAAVIDTAQGGTDIEAGG
jgi:hypothetical protein